MLVTLWSPKGGSGTSVVAAAFASVLARDHHRGAPRRPRWRPAGDLRRSTSRGSRRQRLARGRAHHARQRDRAFTVDDVGRISLVPVAVTSNRRARGARRARRSRSCCATTAASASSTPARVRAGVAVPLVELADLSFAGRRPRVPRRAASRVSSATTSIRATSGACSSTSRTAPRSARRRRPRSGPVLGVVPYVPDVARAVDAGVLLRRVPERCSARSPISCSASASAAVRCASRDEWRRSTHDRR